MLSTGHKGLILAETVYEMFLGVKGNILASKAIKLTKDLFEFLYKELVTYCI